MSDDDDAPRDEDRLEPQSIDGLTPEEALRGFMGVDPEKVKERTEENRAQSEEETKNGK